MSRVSQHIASTKWFDAVRYIEIIPVGDKHNALVKERELIVQIKPLHNRNKLTRKIIKVPIKFRNFDVEKQVVVMNSAGYSFREIGKTLGISRQRAHQILKRKQSNASTPSVRDKARALSISNGEKINQGGFGFGGDQSDNPSSGVGKNREMG